MATILGPVRAAPPVSFGRNVAKRLAPCQHFSRIATNPGPICRGHGNPKQGNAPMRQCRTLKMPVKRQVAEAPTDRLVRNASLKKQKGVPRGETACVSRIDGSSGGAAWDSESG
jgi:hypothetical protein